MIKLIILFYLLFLQPGPSFASSKISIQSFNFAPTEAHTIPHHFEKLSNGQINIHEDIRFSPKRYFHPYVQNKGLSVADFNNDGFIDFAISFPESISIYYNKNGKKFQKTTLQSEDTETIIGIAPVDIDNNGFIDIVVTTFGQGDNYYIPNFDKGFIKNQWIPILNKGAVFSQSMSFLDIDHNQLPDIFWGNAFLGIYSPHSSIRSKNYIVMNHQEIFKILDLPSSPGETFSSLFTNINNSQKLFVVNYLAVPNFVYNIQPDSTVNEVKFPLLTSSSLSISSLDINNDGRLDILSSQISNLGGNINKYAKTIDSSYCDNQNSINKNLCLKNIKYKSLNKTDLSKTASEVCQNTKGNIQHECQSLQKTKLALFNNKIKLCQKIPKQHSSLKWICQQGQALQHESKKIVSKPTVQYNTLYLNNGDQFTDNLSKQYKISHTGWTWNFIAGDFNNDTFLDLHALNGSWQRHKVSTNLYYENNHGKFFKENTKSIGLEEHKVSISGTAADFDNDGDLDMIYRSINSELSIFKNNSPPSNSIKFRLNDHLGNRFCIGCQIKIFASSKQVQQWWLLNYLLKLEYVIPIL